MKTRTKVLAIMAGAVLVNYRDAITELVAPVVVEWMVRDKDYNQLAEELRISGEKTYQTVADKAGSGMNHKTFTHIIGIERWGQSRLKVALGEPLTMDEYDGYRPSKERPWEALRDDFVATRQETIELAKRLEDAAVDPQLVIPHNQFGDLSTTGWLHYLRYHADATLTLIR